MTLGRDTAEWTVEVPEDPAEGGRAAFDPFPCSRRGQRVGAIESAERPQTRARRIDEAVAAAG
ncbi:YdeI/OmpD-associated family protein [Nocardia xishanensis]|uniref:YdeI/OmpD-associated family protein n=1 Tax=Nocardia xishanensis TaxID=238964 RepID=UPI000A7FB27A|nr:YdeI/OmpD-associated family protein [Nocardia xishanensis]